VCVRVLCVCVCVCVSVCCQAKATVCLHELECTSLCAQTLGALPTCLLTAIKNEMWGCCNEL
jgi:hypothetical protein